jgi:uncharacterized membrane protein YeiB
MQVSRRAPARHPVAADEGFPGGDFRWMWLNLSRTLTTTTTALLAVATWLATVVVADRMRRAGYRGPFELLIRRITYQPIRRSVLT